MQLFLPNYRIIISSFLPDSWTAGIIIFRTQKPILPKRLCFLSLACHRDSYEEKNIPNIRVNSIYWHEWEHRSSVGDSTRAKTFVKKKSPYTINSYRTVRTCRPLRNPCENYLLVIQSSYGILIYDDTDEVLVWAIQKEEKIMGASRTVAKQFYGRCPHFHSHFHSTCFGNYIRCRHYVYVFVFI